MTGAAWDQVLAFSDHAIPAPTGSEAVSANFSTREQFIYAAALRYARAGTASYRTKARDAIDVSIDTDLLITDTNQSLAVARNMFMLVLAADLIDLPAFAPTVNERFLTWISAVRTRAYNPRSIWANTEFMGCNGWGMHSQLSLSAINVYLGDFAGPNGLDALYTRFKGVLGDRAAFAHFGNDDVNSGPWTNGYARIYLPDAIENAPVPINPVGATETDTNGVSRSVDGCIVSQHARIDERLARGTGAALLYPPPVYYTYPQTFAACVLEAAEIYYRAGKTGVWDLSTKAIQRMMDRLKQFWIDSGKTAWLEPGPGLPSSTLDGNNRAMGAIANYRYGAGLYPVYTTDPTIGHGQSIAHAEFTHQGFVGYGTTVPPPPPPPPAAQRATVYKSSFVGATATGNQQPAVTIPFQPKLLKLIAEPVATGDTFDTAARLSVGMAAAVGQQVCCAISANPLKKVHSTSGKCLQLIHSDGTVYDADFVSFDNIGGGNWKFTIHWNTAPAVGWTIHVVAIGDDAITNVKVGSFTVPTASGAFSLSGAGFAPDAAHFLLPFKDATSTARFTYGEGFACKEAGALGAISQAFNYVQQLSDGTRSRIQEADACLYGALPDSTHAQDFRAAVTAFAADGIDFNASDGTGQGAGNVPVLYALVKGGAHSVQRITQRGGTGSKVYADPFTPNGLLLSSIGRTSHVGPDTARIDLMLGITDMIRQGSLYLGGTAPGGTLPGGGIRNSFETGLADGTAITIANSDDAGAGDPISAANSSALTFSVDHPANGTLGLKVAATGTGIFVTWSNVNPNGLTTVHGRFYFYVPTGGVTTGVNMATLRSATPATIATIGLDSTRRPRMLTGAGFQIGSLGTALALDTQYRCEFTLTIDTAAGTAGNISGDIYAGNSLTSLMTFGGDSTLLGSAVLDLARLGVNNNVTATIYYDEPVWGANARPGPGPDVAATTDYRARWSQQRIWEDSDAPGVLAASAEVGPEQVISWTANWLTADNILREAIVWAISDDPQAPVLVSAPAVGGQLQVGEVLAAVPGVWDGLQPMTRSYQWLRCDPAGANCQIIPAAVAESYLLSNADFTFTIKVRETATNAVGSATADSAFVGPIIMAAPPPDTPPDPGDPGVTPPLVVLPTTPLRHLRNRLRVCAIEPALFSDTRILELFNEGYVDACKRSKCLRALATVTGGVGSVALPTDFAAIISVFSNGRELPPLPPDVALTRHYSGYETTGSTISFDEGTTGNVYLLYARKPEPFTTIDDIPDPGFPPEFYELLFHYACWRRYAVAGGAGRIGQARWNRDQFDRGIRGLRRQANLVPGENRFVHVLETGSSRVRKFRVGADVDGG